jgi:hypothetical protein
MEIGRIGDHLQGLLGGAPALYPPCPASELRV